MRYFFSSLNEYHSSCLCVYIIFCDRRDGVRLYRGATDCLHMTFRREGPLGPWKGLGASLLCIAPQFAIQITAYNYLTAQVRR